MGVDSPEGRRPRSHGGTYVGLFLAYGVFVSNACYGLEVAYHLLEELEAAYVMDAVDQEQLSRL